jgi:hypothetical protein
VPAETLLYQLIEEHWPTLLERAEQSGGLPDFIAEEFEAYLRTLLAGAVARRWSRTRARSEDSARRAWAGAWLMSRRISSTKCWCGHLQGRRPPRRIAGKIV